MQNIHQDYVEETYDEKGLLKTFRVNVPETFHFAYDIVDKLAELEPDKRALVWCDESGREEEFTFGQLRVLSEKAANFFACAGIQKGDMVMLILKRHYEYWIAMLALHKLGAVAIPATAQLTKKDLAYRFKAASVKAILCTADGETADFVDKAQKEVPSMELKIIARGTRPGWLSFAEGVEHADGYFPRPSGHSVHDPLLMYFTSGTTAMPKMVLHDHSYPLGHIITAKHWQCVNPNGLHLTVAETGWAKASWGKIYGQWIMEAPIFVYDFDKFDPDKLLGKIEKYHITTFCAPPTVYRFFIKEGMAGHDLSSIEHATIAGEALNAEVYNRFVEYTGVPLMEGFGQSESTVMLANLKGMTPKPGSMGRPTPLYHIELVHEDGKPVQNGEVGEIVVDISQGRPAGLFQEYYHAPERNAQACHDGYYHTGDTAWRDEDGYYWYVGRTDDLIKSSGYRIGPFEIESVLMEHPAVLECAVTGAPDPVRGQVVKASIVLTSNYVASEKLEKELKDYVKRQTAPYKYPRIIEFLKELPKTTSGKIRRVEIRNQDSKK
ncbi:MAG: AMP-binding protein [Ethanoligenens sp.]